jgi:ring-1,2-phenylacetyl-CoA epoxidase subunit PaaE
MDGHRKSFQMPRAGTNIVDAAAEHGLELPYSCKGGVCATCRTHVREGEVDMATNYGLEPWEVEKGFVPSLILSRRADDNDNYKFSDRTSGSSKFL